MTVANSPNKEQVPADLSINDAPVASSMSVWRSVRRDVVLLGAGNVGIVIAQLLFRSILIAALIPADYGRLSLVLSIYNTLWIIGASGLPNSAARYIAAIAPADDSAIIRSAIRAGVWPTIIATVIIAIISGLLLDSPLAYLIAAVGLSSLVYSLLTTGILRGRGKIGLAASIMPIAAVGEVTLLAVLWRSGLGVTLLSAFVVFCLGNVIGLIAGIICTLQTAPRRTLGARAVTEEAASAAPSSRQLLGFSLWLGAATVGITILPLILRLAATIDSYTVVAMVDVALVLLSIPQRVGTVMVSAVIPHATRALNDGGVTLTISRREHFLMVAPFVFAALVVAFTPLIPWIFDSLGRPEYAKSSGYLALALLAGPARILYGLVEGVLIAHGKGRFLAINALVITALASVMIVAAIYLGSTLAAFAIFAASFWGIYLRALLHTGQLTSNGALTSTQARLLSHT